MFILCVVVRLVYSFARYVVKAHIGIDQSEVSAYSDLFVHKCSLAFRGAALDGYIFLAYSVLLLLLVENHGCGIVRVLQSTF